MNLQKICLALIVLLVATGCRSRVIQVNLINTSSQPIKTIIVDYPGATFGKDTLAPGKTYQYVIKPVESGALKVQFTNAQGVNHNYLGPVVQKNQEGVIQIILTQDSAGAELKLR